jgi:hypothetical protein
MASTIKVDNIQNQPGTNIINKCSVTTTVGAGAGETVNVCAATVNLGRSGGTVNLTSGATQSGFGRTGTVDWITTPKVTGDSPVTGVTGKGYFMNTTAGTITLNLPAGTAGDIVSLADYAATWQTYNVTVTPNGSEKIGGVNASVTLSTEGQSVTFVYVDSTQGWLNTMDSTSNVRGSAFIIATGGTPACGTICGDYKIHTFTGPGTFCVSNVSTCAAENLVSYVVVAGGGGASGPYGGGAGAGGFREVVSPSAPYTGSPLDGYPTPANRVTITATGYPITVGAGGTNPGGSPARGCNGANSVFSTITAAGGGGGGAGGPPAPICHGPGLAGGSGGAGTGYGPGTRTGGAGNTPPTTPAQGSAGGEACAPSAGHSSAGGGGAGAAGGNVPNPGVPGPGGGTGGIGVPTFINPSPSYGEPGPAPGRYFAGGGGGGSWSPSGPAVGGCGGAGGGSNGRQNNSSFPGSGDNAKDAVANMGGGAGGGGDCSPGARQGGSGIVFIRYKFQ